MGLIGVLAFVVALLTSVMIHEAGHYFTAKSFGMKVTEFFLGFGKRIWSTQRGETEFGIKAIPAGGYCRIVGMSASEELSEQSVLQGVGSKTAHCSWRWLFSAFRHWFLSDICHLLRCWNSLLNFYSGSSRAMH